MGKVGQDLSSHAHATPLGGEVCALKEALAAQPGAPEKAIADVCSKQIKADLVWRRGMLVLSAYGELLEAVAQGTSSSSTGPLAAARTGVEGKDWAQVDGAEAAARDAISDLVEQLRSTPAKPKLETTIKTAAPRVKTLCDGLVGYLDEQAKALGDVQKDIEKKRVSRTDRRCTMVDAKSVCVQDSSADRVVYAHAVGQLAMLESAHADAHDAVAGFCSAHAALDDAAAKGHLGDDATTTQIVTAVKSSRRAAPSSSPPAKK